MKSKKNIKAISLELLKITASLVPGVDATIDILTAIKATTEIIKSKEFKYQEPSAVKEYLDEIAKQESQKSQSIVEIMIDNKGNKVQKAYILLAITLLAQLGFAYFTKSEVNNWFMFLTLFLAGVIYLNQVILEYRIKKGLYGTNDYEAREIIEFIFTNAEYIDLSGGGGAKRIFPEPEKETKENIVPEGGVVA